MGKKIILIFLCIVLFTECSNLKNIETYSIENLKKYDLTNNKISIK